MSPILAGSTRVTMMPITFSANKIPVATIPHATRLSLVRNRQYLHRIIPYLSASTDADTFLNAIIYLFSTDERNSAAELAAEYCAPLDVSITPDIFSAIRSPRIMTFGPRNIIPPLFNSSGSRIPDDSRVRSEAIRMLVKAAADTILAATAEVAADTSFDPVENTFMRQMNISADEMRIISFIYFFLLDDPYCIATNCIIESHDTITSLVSYATGIDHETVCRLLDRDAMIQQRNMISLDINNLRNVTLYVNSSIADFLFSKSSTIADNAVIPVTEASFSVDSFDIKPEILAAMRHILASGAPANILLHGAPGTGKTEFARSIAVETGRTVHYVDPGVFYWMKTESRIYGVMSAARAAHPGDIMIIDDSDMIFANRRPSGVTTVSVDKDIINRFLETHELQIIWIANSISSADPASLRRFAFNISFESFTPRQRLTLWQRIANDAGISETLGTGTIERLAASYEVNAGGIGLAINTLARIRAHDPESMDSPIQLLETLLRRHASLTGATIRDSTSNINQVVDQYDPDALNLDGDPEAIIRSLERAWKRICSGETARIQFNLLFSGAPGTGKTEFARFAANRIGVPITARRASDFLGMFVGQTEKNIAAAFAQAEREGHILLIDECETMLGRRDASRQSWEIGRTNEMLTRMESFRGILICSTNHPDMLTSASLRRFHCKLTFSPPSAQARRRLFDRYFGSYGAADAALLRRLDGMEDLTPGDIRAVWQRIIFDDEQSLTPECIMNEIERELQFHARTSAHTVGF